MLAKDNLEKVFEVVYNCDKNNYEWGYQGNDTSPTPIHSSNRLMKPGAMTLTKRKIISLIKDTLSLSYKPCVYTTNMDSTRNAQNKIDHLYFLYFYFKLRLKQEIR